MRYFVAAALALAAHVAAADAPKPMRPLPVASSRPAGKGPRYLVDPKGDDAGDGSAAHPWKTIAHAVAKLHPGDTLYLRARGPTSSR